MRRLCPPEWNVTPRLVFPTRFVNNEEFKFHESQGPYRQMITLPSVNRPGERVVFRCGNSRQISDSPNAGRGLLEALIDVPLEVNCSQEEILAPRRFLRDFKKPPRSARS